MASLNLGQDVAHIVSQSYPLCKNASLRFSYEQKPL